VTSSTLPAKLPFVLEAEPEPPPIETAGTPEPLRDKFPLRLLIAGEDVTFETSEGFTFSSVDPGGYEAASFPLPKDMPSLKRGQPVRLESGMQVAWEGRVKEIQRSLGAKTLVQCEGYRAILKDNTLAEIFLDRDLTKWLGPGVERRKDRLANSYVSSSGELVPSETGLPSLALSATGPWEASARPWSEAWYNGHGIPIASLHYNQEHSANVGTGEGVPWVWEAGLSFSELNSGGEGTHYTGNLKGVPTTGDISAGGATNCTWANILFWFGEAGGGSGSLYTIYWHSLGVYGNHGLKQRPSPITPSGFYPSDIAGYAVGKCPGIQVGVIQEASQYVVPHSAYLTPVPVEQIVSDMAKFAGWHWGVWESQTYLLGAQTPRVDFRAYPERGKPTAWCWRRETENLDIRENIENLYDSARVVYTEPIGVERAIEVSKPNPALEAVGLHRQVVLGLGTGTQPAAEAFGLIQLDLLADQARMTGSATITDAIHEMNGATKPAWLLKAGLDRLRIPDLPCSDAFGAHNDLLVTRVECAGSQVGLVTNVEFGLGSNLIETLTAQLQANITAGVR
jgi:hypothetical protein